MRDSLIVAELSVEDSGFAPLLWAIGIKALQLARGKDHPPHILDAGEIAEHMNAGGQG